MSTTAAVPVYKAMDEEKKANSFGRELLRRVREYLRDGEHRKDFEDWYLEKHGTPYEWKKERYKNVKRQIPLLPNER